MNWLLAFGNPLRQFSASLASAREHSPLCAKEMRSHALEIACAKRTALCQLGGGNTFQTVTHDGKGLTINNFEEAEKSRVNRSHASLCWPMSLSNPFKPRQLRISRVG